MHKKFKTVMYLRLNTLTVNAGTDFTIKYTNTKIYHMKIYGTDTIDTSRPR